MVNKDHQTSACRHLVLDAAPFIQGVRVDSFAENFYTIPEVVLELKDKNAKIQLDRINYKLRVEQPSAEALKEVISFAKKTGDFAVLSATDLKVIALCKTIAERSSSEETDLSERLEQVNLNAGKEASDRPSFGEPSFPKPDEGRSASSSESDSDGEWITPGNVRRHRMQEMGHVKESQEVASVACMSSDMAVQNVLLQMKLGLVSVDGIIVKQLRNWVLRCHACYFITKDSSKKFCPRCGKSTLMRCSYSVDASGRVRYHLRKNFQYNNRGTVYSIPATKGGRNAGNLILAEDQAEFQRAQHRQRRAEEKLANSGVSLFDQDFLPGLLGQAVTNSYTRNSSTYTGVADISVGHGRKNVNQVRKHGGKKRK